MEREWWNSEPADSFLLPDSSRVSSQVFTADGLLDIKNLSTNYVNFN